MGTHFEAKSGALYNYASDGQTRKIIKHPVAYADIDKKPGETPFIPDIEFQEKFDVALKSALAEVATKADNRFVWNERKNTSLKEVDFVDGDLVGYYVREDKVDQWPDFSVEFRASMMVPYFMLDRRNGMKNKMVADFLEIDKKRG
jgi:hypothetical protein